MSDPARIVVVGAGGFGRETLDVLEAMSGDGAAHRVVGVVDDHPPPANLARLADRGIPHLGGVDGLLAAGAERYGFVVAIGDPRIRARLAQRLEAAGHRPYTAVHPTAVLGSRVRLGPGCVVCAGVLVSTNVTLGRHVHLNPGCVVGHDTTLRDFVSVNPSATLSGEVVVAEHTLVGAAAVVLQNLTVGPTTIVGAGAVVTRDVPAGVVVTGIPGRWDQEGNA